MLQIKAERQGHLAHWGKLKVIASYRNIILNKYYFDYVMRRQIELSIICTPQSETKPV